MAEIRDFLPDVRPFTPGAPDVMIEREIRNGCIRFCRDTYTWQQEIDRLEVKEDKAAYEYGFDFVNIVSESDMIGIAKVGDGLEFEFNGDILRPIGAKPGETLKLIGYLQPSRTADRVPDRLYNDYRDTIAAYALYRLLLQPNVEWSNPQFATVQHQSYLDGVGEERNRMLRDYSTQSITVHPVHFA